MTKKNEGTMKKGTSKRLLKYISAHYKFHLIIVFICIILSGISATAATVFLQKLIDDCITPGIKNGMSSVAGKMTLYLISMAVIYLIGVLSSFIFTRIMATVTQGTLKNLRNDMFNHMETLPIRYFDTHAHGDIMSTYTNDTDAIRQMIGQSAPMILQSLLSIAAIIVMMLSYSLILSLVVAVFIFMIMSEEPYIEIH